MGHLEGSRGTASATSTFSSDGHQAALLPVGVCARRPSFADVRSSRKYATAGCFGDVGRVRMVDLRQRVVDGALATL